MEGILYGTEIPPLMPFDTQQPILYFPVRHHSPGCCYHLQKVLTAYEPDCILVEGPQTANKLLPVLTDSGTVPPVAFYYFYKDTAKYVSEEGDDYKCYYPFLRTSPEYQALCYARQHHIDSSFIDLPYGDILIHTAAEKGLRSKQEISAYSDEHYLAESRYFSALCEKAGVRSFEEFWEKYFEIDALSIHTEEYIRRMYTYCYITRCQTPADEMLTDGCLVRESFMADNIRQAAKTHRRVLVVTGGFHSYGLYQLLTGAVRPQKYRLHTFSEKVQDVYAMTYSFEAADALSGYSAGMQHPYFYDRVWEGILTEEDPQQAYPSTVLHTLLQCAKACTKEKMLVTMSDISSAVTMLRGLAALRDKRSEGLYELYDSVRSCFIKGEVNEASAVPLRLLGKIAAGQAIGRLCDSAEKVPLVQDFEKQAKHFKLKVGSVTEQKSELEVFSKPTHRALSRLFYRTGFLETSFARRLKGADPLSGKDRSRVREQWAYKRSAEVDAALIDASAYGGTIEEACTVLSLRRLRDVQKCGEAAKLYVECFLMGLSATDGFSDRMEDILLSDGDFFSLGQGLYYFQMLHGLQVLYDESCQETDRFLQSCFLRAVVMLPAMIHVTDDRADECIRLCRLLFSLISGEEDTSGIHLPPEYGEMLRDAFIRMTQAQDPCPSVCGAVLGLLYGGDSSFRQPIRQMVAAYLSGTKELQKQGAAFLRGLFATARDIVLVGDEFIRITDRLLHSFTTEEFMEVLPEMRLAFSYFSPYEVDRIAASVAALYGIRPEEVRETFRIRQEVYTAGRLLEESILAQMR